MAMINVDLCVWPIHTHVHLNPTLAKRERLLTKVELQFPIISPEKHGVPYRYL